MDPREWPTEEAELASFGADHLLVITEHFAEILGMAGCDRSQARHQELPSAQVVIKAMPQAQQTKVWADFFKDRDRLQSFPNLLMVVELILVLPLSTAACECGFSAMKRVKTDCVAAFQLICCGNCYTLASRGQQLPTSMRNVL